jgi:hypothetical protein
MLLRVPEPDEISKAEKTGVFSITTVADFPIHFRCPKCFLKYTVRSEQAGKSGKCKQCNASLRVPRNEPDSSSGTTGVLTTLTVDVIVKAPVSFMRRVLESAGASALVRSAKRLKNPA